MITKNEYEKAKLETIKYFEKVGIALTEEEKGKIEVADFGIGDLQNTGLQILTYVNTDRVCAKELVMTKYQTCPEHLHPKIDNYPGKEETFRCRYGRVYLYVDGNPTENCQVSPPEGVYTVFNEIILNPGEQYTLSPNTKHWFKSGEDGAVVSEFSTSSYDDADIFSDPRIARIPEVE